MSLFIGSPAFEQGGPSLGVDERIGILSGSLISGLLGYVVLRFAATGILTAQLREQLREQLRAQSRA